VQLIYGADDRLTTPQTGAEMQRQIPGARLTVIEGAGHLVNIERGPEFNDVLLDFLNQNRHIATGAD
jgi:pimeloyl-ACP methyl ester carboxylesterase